jgi:uncharacterized protein YjdB
MHQWGRRAGRTGVLGLVTLAVGGCLDLKVIPDACSVTVAPAAVTLPINGSTALAGTAFDCTGNSILNKRISFSSSNPAVATVSPVGVVIGVAVGGATISASANGKSASTEVTVTPEAAATVTITPSTLLLRKTNTRQLTAVARNAQNNEVKGRTFRWTTSNPAVATVDQTGLVTAIGAGTANIVAETNQVLGGAVVTVTEIPLGSCTLAPTSSKLTVTQSVQPALTLRDTAGTVVPSVGRSILWQSTNEAVAVVSPTGLVTTRKAGSAVISATSVEFPTVTCRTAVEAVDPRIVQVIITPRTGQLRLGIPRGLGVTLLDSTQSSIPSGRSVTWSSGSPTTALVSQAGIVTGIALGTARVIATAEGVADTVQFAVTAIPVGTITISPLQASVREGGTVQLRATVQDSAGTTVTDRPVEWVSSDLARATVSQSGLVTARSPGNVLISATTEGRTGQHALTITAIPVDTILMDTTATLLIGQTSAVAIALRDAAGGTLNFRNVLVTSSNPGVVIGAANAQSTQVTISGISEGTARLTVQAIDDANRPQGKASRITVTVNRPPPPPPSGTRER